MPSRIEAFGQVALEAGSCSLPTISFRNTGVEDIVDHKKNKVNGSIKLKLYKGNITIQSRTTNSEAYSMKKVSFEENKSFNKSNVEKFINFHKKKLRN